MNPKFSHQQYRIRKQVLSLAGARIDIFDTAGRAILFSKMKAFKLKEDIRLFEDESMTKELVTIQARNVIDFSAIYDVVDAETGGRIGSLQRKGMKSMFKDEWSILNANEAAIGLIQEDNAWLAFVRRFLTQLIPQKFKLQIDSRQVALFRQNFNPFVSKLHLDFSQDTGNQLDRRLGLAAAVLMLVVEGKQG
ncbi:hypothetical protein [Paenibacillus sp. HB172176]|uniref:hypothetical protein n=1 Tax=Paenibacillus sp. HB172176 TaxID=2493690 RepID=UPI00143C9F7F|nr:hypothetical protein [Paenibacillus sp. HB172176]